MTPYQEKIYNNPFRILGVYANASIKDVKANGAKAKAFLNVGKDVTFPCDFNQIMPSVERTSEMMTFANAQLALPNDKIKHALFWFVKVTPLDEVAFNHLANGNFEHALEIWRKKVCFSSLLNTSSLALVHGHYLLAIDSIIKMLESEKHKQDFISSVVDETFQISTEELIHSYLDVLISDSIIYLLESSTLSNTYKDYVKNKVVKPIINEVETEVTKTKSIEHENSLARYNAGIRLMNLAKNKLAELNKLLGGNNMRYQIIADKLGLEILQCGIDYYNNSNDEDAAHKAMKLQSYAQSVVVGQMAKDRCKQNTDILRKIIEELPPLEVLEEDKQIKKELALFFLRPNNIESANELMKNCAPYIIRIKEKLGTTHKYYLNISTQIVQGALHNVIEEVNKTIDDVNEKLRQIWGMKSVLSDAWRTTLNMEQFGMQPFFRNERFLPQKNALYQILSSTSISVSSIKPDIDLRTDEERYNSCKTIDDYDKYLKAFLHGRFVEQAKQKIDYLTFISCRSKVDYQRYVRLHPNGKYLTQAKNKISEIQRIEDEKKKQESDMFHSCHSIVDYENYISKYQHGMYLDDARERIRKLEARRNIIIWLVIIVLVLIAVIFYNKDKDLKAFEDLKERTTIEKCQTFIERYPNSIKVSEVEKMIRKQYEDELIRCKDSVSLSNFINKYSTESKYIKSRYKKEYKQKYIDMAIASLKAETERLKKEREERHRQEMKEWSTESKAWKKALQGGTLDLFKKYLSLYPYGAHSVQAKQKIIDLEVSNVFASGNYGQLPSMDRTGYSNSAFSTVSVRNDTQYTLTLLYSGAESKRLIISPYSSRSVQLKSGSYRIVASVDAYNVRNFAGREELMGGSYDVSYYIQTSRY